MGVVSETGSSLLTLVQLATMVGVGLTILIQTVTFIWFMSRLAFRVDRLEQDLTAIKSKGEQDNFSVRFAKMETILEIIQRQQDEQLLKIEAARSETNKMHEQINLFLRKGEGEGK